MPNGAACLERRLAEGREFGTLPGVEGRDGREGNWVEERWCGCKKVKRIA